MQDTAVDRESRVEQAIWRDDGFGFSEKLGRLGEFASGPGGGRIWDLACREDGIGLVRRRLAKVKVGQERLLAEQTAGQIKEFACWESRVGWAAICEGESW